MRRLLVCVVLFVLASTASAERVVLLSVDAGSDALLDSFLRSGALSRHGFEQIVRRGFVAESMTPAAVASTPVSHPTMFTGTWPGTHGITGVAIPGDDFTGDLRNGFTVPTSVDRLWTVAQNSGKRVICILAPGADATSPATTCTETVPFDAITRRGPTPSLSALEKIIGPSPGDPSSGPVTKGESTEEEYVVASEQFADYVSGAVKAMLIRNDWDLLIVYMPLLDGLEHRYLLTDARQAEFHDEHDRRRARFAGFIERGYRKIDSIVAEWLAAAPATNFVVVSDHGMIPTHSVVLVANALAAAGLKVAAPDAQVRAISSGASVQVYINSKRRFRNGTVSDEELPAIQARVVKALRDVRDPANGSPIFATIIESKDFTQIHLNHENAGDVYASAASGWGTTGRYDPAVPMIVPNTLSADTRDRVSRSDAEKSFLQAGRHNELSIGIHGHRPGDRRLQAIFYAIGPNVPRGRTGVIPMIDVAPTVLRMLGVPQPASMTGKPVFGERR